MDGWISNTTDFWMDKKSRKTDRPHDRHFKREGGLLDTAQQSKVPFQFTSIYPA